MSDQKLTNLIKYGFYLLIIVLPWQTRLIWRDAFLNGSIWEYGRFSLYASEIFLALWFMLYGAWLWRARRQQHWRLNVVWQRLRQPAIGLYWLAVGLLLAAGVSVIFSFDADLAYTSWIRLLEAGALFSAITVLSFDFKKISIAWVMSAVIQSLFGIVQFFTQFSPANKWLGLAEHWPSVGGSVILQTSTERWLRAYGSFPHPNILGGFLVIGLLCLAYLLLNSKTLQQRLMLDISLVIIAIGLFLSFSRSAWGATILTLVALGVWTFRQHQPDWQKRFMVMAVIIVLTLVPLTAMFSELVSTRMMGQEPVEVNSIQLRLTFTEQAWQLIQNNFWTGTGVGNYTLGVYQQINGSWPAYYYQPVHNLYLLILTELGVIGFGLFIILLGWLAVSLVKAPGSLEKITVGLMLAAVLFISLFDHYFWTLFSGILMFWIILGLSLKQLK